ncbi:MAG: CoA transferase, partial [Dehalococcoidia bacterium]|nr:CoA transferase [Dehalococcoidia bacterium]
MAKSAMMSSKPKGPFEGVRIIDLSRTLAGAQAAGLLGDMGAEVIMVENNAKAEGGVSPRGLAGTIVNGIDGRYNFQSRNRMSVAVDMDSSLGKEVFYDLVRVCDGLVENYRPGVTERKGLDYATLSRVNPRLVYCSISGFGQTGPYRSRVSWDLIGQAASGLMSVLGEPGRPPSAVGFPIIDTCTGMNAAQALTAGLFHQQRTGEGQWVQTSLLETGLALSSYFPTMYFAGGEVPGPTGGSLPVLAVNGVFRTSDGHMMTGVINEWQLVGLCRAIGRQELADDPRYRTEEKRFENQPEMLSLIREAFVTRTTDEWVEALNAEDVGAAPVNTLDKALEDPQVADLGMVVETEGVEGRLVKMTASPLHFSAFPVLEYHRAPHAGEHTHKVLASILGYSDSRIAEL